MKLFRYHHCIAAGLHDQPSTDAPIRRLASARLPASPTVGAWLSVYRRPQPPARVVQSGIPFLTAMGFLPRILPPGSDLIIEHMFCQAFCSQSVYYISANRAFNKSLLQRPAAATTWPEEQKLGRAATSLLKNPPPAALLLLLSHNNVMFCPAAPAPAASWPPEQKSGRGGPLSRHYHLQEEPHHDHHHNHPRRRNYSA